MPETTVEQARQLAGKLRGWVAADPLLRDKNITTTTYIVDLSGRLHKVCDSVGFGLPYATQYTAPSRTAYDYHDSAVIPQADPNGLYSPASADGTWVQCLNPKTHQTTVVYIEPRVIVSSYELDVK